jgi:GDP-4-dehydro-6-deoxy-D-mannose reductase
MATPAASRRCLVFGANGFIGKHVLASQSLLARELDASPVEAPADVDIRERASLRALIDANAPDYVIHLAAATFVPDSIADPTTTYDVNFTGTLNLLSALAAADFKGRMLFASSAEVYGAVAESALPIRETQPFAPRTPYAVSKAAGELLCLQHALVRGIDVCIVRPFNIIGAGQSSKFAVSSFARQIAELERQGGGVLSVGNLDVTRDFIDVGDAVAAFVAILRAGRRGEAYNLCSGVETHVGHLLDQLRSLSTADIGVRVDPDRMRPAEQRRVRGDHAKLTTDTGWQPSLPITRTLYSVLSDWRTRGVLA